MNIQALHFAKICKAVLAIFAPLPRLFSIFVCSLLLLYAKGSLWAQDSVRNKAKVQSSATKKPTPKPKPKPPATIVLEQSDEEETDTSKPKDNYKPYYNWEELSDSLYEAYKLNYPWKWQKDSTYYAGENKKFIDTALNSDELKQRLFYPKYEDTLLQGGRYTDNPLPNDAQKIKKPIPLWIFLMVLLALVGVLFLKYSNFKLFNLLFLSFFSPKNCEEALSEQDTPINVYNLAATLICTLVYSIIIWFIAVEPGWLYQNNNHLVTFLLIFTIISVFYLLRFLFIMLVAALLETEHTYGVLVQVTVSGNMWLAIVLPAVVLFNATFLGYNTTIMLFYYAIGLLIYLIIKQVRVMVQVTSGFPHSIIYLILYLCALEIAPYLVVFKAIIKLTGE